MNLDEKLKKGLESLQERVRNREMVCFITDKGGRCVCDSLENYRDNWGFFIFFTSKNALFRKKLLLALETKVLI